MYALSFYSYAFNVFLRINMSARLRFRYAFTYWFAGDIVFMYSRYPPTTDIIQTYKSVYLCKVADKGLRFMCTRCDRDLQLTPYWANHVAKRTHLKNIRAEQIRWTNKCDKRAKQIVTQASINDEQNAS